MNKWLFEAFAASRFNTCPRQPLPCMYEVQIHLDENAKPKASHTPAPIPIHWQEQVHANLLHVIEWVPYGEPVDWYHRMVITRKDDGSPTRTVDLSPLNKHCKRETFFSQSSFQVACKIPNNTCKIITDAWNGYHGMVLW